MRLEAHTEAAMKLHWSPRSPFVRKVMVVAHDLGLAAHIQCVRTVAAMMKPHADLMIDNPLSKIPTLVLDDGTVLYNSAVICEYLDHLHDGPKLFPLVFEERMTALRRQALGDGWLDALVLWRGELSRPPEQQSQPYLKSFSVRNEATLAALEREAPALEIERLFDRSCRARLRALLSRLPVRRQAVASGSSAAGAVARGICGARIGACDRTCR